MAGASKTHHNLPLGRPGKPPTNDLPARGDVAGGKIAINENLTLVRVTSRAKQDLPARER